MHENEEHLSDNRHGFKLIKDNPEICILKLQRYNKTKLAEPHAMCEMKY
jgi:hypothetical protein